MSLEEIIKQKIRSAGALRFRDYMEMCLYYPGKGYYNSPGIKIGKQGDYYTSPVMTSLFGQLIARQLEEMWTLMGKGSFTVIEFGAGTGLLCHDILKSLSKNEDFFKELNYCIIEKNPFFEQQQKNILLGKVSWYKDLSDLTEVEGCILSNELVDNFSIHQVIMMEELMEVYVDHQDGKFKEILKLADPLLLNYFNELNVRLPSGFRTEVNLEAINWVKNIATILKKGYVITIDYGFPSFELYKEYRREGNLVCYYKHQVNLSPYHHIGQQDITTHINFSALNHWGLKHGLCLTGYTNQAQFLLGLGMAEYIRSCPPPTITPYFLKTLLLDLGKKMKILIQQKNTVRSFLSGLRFSEPLA
jgi:SAM-dependent MidA family methyltransferase